MLASNSTKKRLHTKVEASFVLERGVNLQDVSDHLLF